MHKGNCTGVGMVAAILLIIGGINWGLVGLGGFLGKNLNVVNMLLGTWPQVEWAVYILVGLSAIYALMMCKDMCSMK